MHFKELIIICAVFLLVVQLSSCGQSDSEERAEAILHAQILLSTRQCDSAIKVLEAVGRDNTNAPYLQTLAAAYACRGNYSTPGFFGNDLPSFNTSGGLGGLTTFTTSSSMDSYDNDDYEDLQTAIDILLYAGGLDVTKDPTIARRAAVFSAADVKNINAQLLYMIMVQMGRYLYYYGNADENGLKGQGTGSNDCLANYDLVDGAVDATLTAAGGSCTSVADDGHTDLGTDGNLNIERMCQGVVLFNNFVVLLPEVISDFSGDEFDGLNLADFNAAMAAFLAALPGGDDVAEVLSQDRCEGLSNIETDIQYYFIYIFEVLFLSV